MGDIQGAAEQPPQQRIQKDSDMNMTIKVLGAKPQDYALINDEQGKWYATCKPEHAEAVKAVIAEAIAKQANPSL
jgi:hypothetical protein